MTTIEKDILTTLSFFHVLKQPLTLIELHRQKHGTSVSISKVHSALRELQSQGLVIQQEGVFAHASGEKWITRRIHNDQARNAAWERVHAYLPWLVSNPYVQAVAIANSCAFDSMTHASDIDLFIVTKKNRVWSARMLAALPAKLKKIRPGETEIAPLCLSFFVDETALSMEPHLIKDDIYFAHWADSLCWVYDPHSTREAFRTQNSWAQHVLNRPLNIAYTPIHSSSRKQIQKIMSMSDHDAIEKWLRVKQKAIMPQALKTAAEAKGAGVVISDHVIKMHLDDRRDDIINEYMQLCAEIVPANVYEKV